MYFYVHILIHSFTSKVAVVKLLDYLLDITAWSELEAQAQAFRYTHINIC